MILILILIKVFFSTKGLIEVRNSYRYAKESKEKTEKFYQLTEKSKNNGNIVFSAYHGCALTLKAAFASNNLDKMSFFKKGKKLIEAAIESEPNNIELRMIRLSVQSAAPRFLGYHKNIDSDKEFIIKNVDNISSSDLETFIRGFMSDSEIFSR